MDSAAASYKQENDKLRVTSVCPGVVTSELAHTITDPVAAEAMKVLLRTFIRHPASWVRFDGTTEWALTVTGKEQEVSSCLAVLERDLAEGRGARSRGEITTSFPRLQDDE